MKAIDEIKEFLEARNPWELMLIMGMLFFLVGLTAGYVAGEYQTKTVIKEQLQSHVIAPEDTIQQQDYFSLDGTYLYYLIKTNITIDEYKLSLRKEMEINDYNIPEQTDAMAKS